MSRLDKARNLHDFEALGRRHLPRPLFGYIANSAEEGHTHAANRRCFDQFGLMPQALVDVSYISLQTELWGETYRAPFGIAPMGISALSAYRGDIVQARAAAREGVPMILSGSSLIPLEEVLLARVERAGYKKLVITVDYPVPPNSDNNRKSGFSSPLRPSLRLALDGITRPRWLFGTFLHTIYYHGMPHFENNYATRGIAVMSKNVNRDFSGRSHLQWEYLERVRALWPGKLIVKGILNPADAKRVEALGGNAVIVSNHGGRQLDYSPAALEALPGVVDAVEHIPVMIDSGFRRGTDVIKALALGAAFVFIGRPMNYAAAVAGEAGVRHALNLVKEELARDLALMGVTDITHLGREHLIDRRTEAFAKPF
ncbi:alpha-hydroxy acid oxidase [Halomonas sp. PAMB 3232]|uniref:alpha-hydroxy acid oxidase n=1 Tax=Halomonas sp. PAMB 3232 TaxID=3075221 RepID=UPI00289C8EBA|nr:alpha-hydroxy acid oxidase [Halomonas sp. PAMB 3232]WNL40041.1 alpha-hydroxy acid oxidase [Halomonas sp. PAMB 3232]